MMQIEQPVEGVFLDIGWTMNAPAGGDWLLTPYFHEALPRAACSSATLRAISRGRATREFSRC